MSEESNEIPSDGAVEIKVDDSASAPVAMSAEDSANALWRSLRETREARGLSIVEVAHYLKFTPKQVEAMEAGALQQLPGPAFTRGFVRNYARFLQLDVRPFMAALEPVREDVSLQPPMPRLGNMPSSRVLTRYPALPASLATLALLAVVFAGWYFKWFEPRDEAFLTDVMSQSEAVAQSAPSAVSAPIAAPAIPAITPMASAPTAIASAIPGGAASAPVAANQTTAPAPIAGIKPPSAASAPVAVKPSAVVSQSTIPSETDSASNTRSESVPAAGRKRVNLAFNDEAWVEVTDATGRIIYSRLNEPGSKQEVHGVPPLSLVIGNAREVSVSFNGKVIDLAPYTKINVARLKLQ